MTHIREATAADEDRVLDLWQQMQAHHDAVQEVQPAGWTHDPTVIRSQIQEAWASPDSCQIFVASAGDEILGFVKVSQREEFYHHTEVNTLVVDARQRGAGIGSALLERALEWCREKGEPEVELGVVAGNTRAAQLYERMGFEPYLVRYVKKF